MDNRSAALGFCARGWAVFRVQPGRKTPLPGTRGLLDASADDAVVDGWWREMPDANVGLALGASGLLCVDVETAEHEWLDELLACGTFTQCTASGGWHFLFQQPQQRVPNVPLGALDADAEIRGDGGYILLAPSAIFGSASKTGYASKYQLVDGGDVKPAPGWLLDKITKYQSQGVRQRAALRLAYDAVLVKHHDAGSRLDELRQVLQSAVPGQRNHTLRSVACSVGRVVAGGYISASEAKGMMQGWVADWESERKNQDCIRRGIDDGMLLQPWYPDEEPLADSDVEKMLQSVVAVTDSDGPRLTALDDVADGAGVAQNVQHGQSGQSIDTVRQEISDRVAALSDISADFIELCEASAMYWQPGYAVASAVALGSVLGARRVVWPGRNALTTSLYALIAGDSAEGKSTAKAAISMCLDGWPALRGGDSIGSAAANFQAIKLATDNGHGQIWVLDEYYKVLEAMNNPNAITFAENRALLLEMATINAGTFRRKKSKMDSQDGELFETLHVPGFSILALSATEKLFQTLGKSSVADGFVPRHLLFMPQSQLPQKRRGLAAQPSARLMGAIGAARDVHDAWIDRLGTKLWDGGHPVDVDDDAAGIIADFGDALDTERRGGRSEVPAPILGRGEEQAQRVAMCLAQLAQAGSKTLRIDAELAFLACDVVTLCMKDMASALAAHTYDSQYERHLGVLLRALDRHAGVDGWVPWSKVLQACRVGNSQYIGQLVQHLAGAGEIEVRESEGKTQGPKAHHLRIVKK